MTAAASAGIHEWSVEAFLSKAQVYAGRMTAASRDEWDFGLWSALLLELLARAALSHTSPCLLAELSDWKHIYFALTGDNKGKTSPKSVSTSKVIALVNELHTDLFTQECAAFSQHHINRRNEEFHSGGLPFQNLRTSEWLPNFYVSCRALLNIMGKELGDIFDQKTQAEAESLIEAYYDKSAKSVQKTVQAHKLIWEQKGTKEREELAERAKLLMAKQFGHRVKCPACGSTAILQGEETGIPQIDTDDVYVIVKQAMLPISFECIACGLKMTGYSKLKECGLGDHYTSTVEYDPVEYFGIEMPPEPGSREWYAYMEDNNE